MFDRKRMVSRLIDVADPVPLFNENIPIIFFWSPKSGCTSLIKWFYFQMDVLDKALSYKPYVDSMCRSFPWVHGYRMEIHLQQEGYKTRLAEALLNREKGVYKLVRNPYTRAVSSFFIMLTIPALNKAVFPEGIRDGVSFKSYLYKLKMIGVERVHLNYHLAKQYTEYEERIVNQFILLENFEVEIRAIEEKYNLLSSPISSLVQSFHHKAPNMTIESDRLYSNEKMTLAKLRGTIPNYQSFYDTECKDLVWELFNDDFVKYGYCRHSI